MGLLGRVKAWWNGPAIREFRDMVYVTRARAVEMGFSHTAQFCGCFHYVILETPRTAMEAMPRWGVLEIWCTAAIRWHQFKNDWNDTNHEFVFRDARALAGAGLVETITVTDEWAP